MGVSNLSSFPKVNYGDALSVVQAAEKSQDPNLRSLANHLQDTYDALKAHPSLDAAKEYTTTLGFLSNAEANSHAFDGGTWTPEQLKAAAQTALAGAGVSDDDIHQALSQVTQNIGKPGVTAFDVTSSLDFSQTSLDFSQQ